MSHCSYFCPRCDLNCIFFIHFTRFSQFLFTPYIFFFAIICHSSSPVSSRESLNFHLGVPQNKINFSETCWLFPLNKIKTQISFWACVWLLIETTLSGCWQLIKMNTIQLFVLFYYARLLFDVFIWSDELYLTLRLCSVVAVLFSISLLTRAC